MSTSEESFVPAELLGDRFRPIGGSFGSLDLAVDAAKAHFRNKHGGGGAFRLYQSQGSPRKATIIEVCLDEHRPLMIQAIYKVFEGNPEA